MNKLDVKGAFRKVMLSFNADRMRYNSFRYLIASAVSLLLIAGYYFYSRSSYALWLIVLPIGLLWMSLDLSRKSKNASMELKTIHNVELTNEVRKFTGKGFKPRKGEEL